MRTTLDIDEDVLLAAKKIAKKQGISTGKALSQLAREAFTRQAAIAKQNGVPLFPRQPDAEVVTLEIVNQLRDGSS